MSKFSRQFKMGAFAGFYKRPSEAAHESDVVAHAVFKDDKGTAIVDIAHIQWAAGSNEDPRYDSDVPLSERFIGGCGVSHELACHALDNYDVECDIEGKPILGRS